jgi:hypothetical protein
MANTIRMDLNNWTYADFYAANAAIKDGDQRKAMELVHKLLIGWDYPVPLADENAMARLSVADSAEVVRTAFTRLGTFLEDLDVSDVKVDLKPWSTETYWTFDEARRMGRVAKAERMVREVVEWDKLPDDPDEPFSFVVGATVFKAVNDKYTRIIQGKN